MSNAVYTQPKELQWYRDGRDFQPYAIERSNGSRVLCSFKSFAAAHDTLVGIELMHMLKKRQLVGTVGAESHTAAEQFYALAA